MQQSNIQWSARGILQPEMSRIRACAGGSPCSAGHAADLSSFGLQQAAMEWVPGEYCSKKCRAAGPTPAASGSVSAATKPVPAASAQKPATCAASGCQRASWNGKSGECCSVECRDQYNKEISRFAKDPGSVMCARQGCNNQPWNGMQGEYCSKACRYAGPATAAPAANSAPDPAKAPATPVTCARVGCKNAPWNGKSGEFCSLFCFSGGSNTAAQHFSAEEVPVPKRTSSEPEFLGMPPAHALSKPEKCCPQCGFEPHSSAASCQ